MTAMDPHFPVAIHLRHNGRPQPPATADLCASRVAMDLEVEVSFMAATDPHLPVVVYLCRKGRPQPLAAADLYASTVPPQ